MGRKVVSWISRRFAPEAPPKYIRAQFYDYTFAGSEERSQGRYWHRQLLGEYFPSVYFKGRDGTD